MNKALYVILIMIVAVTTCAGTDKVKIKNLRKEINDSYDNKKLLYIKRAGNIDFGYVKHIVRLDNYLDYFNYMSLRYKKEIEVYRDDLEEAFTVNNEIPVNITLPDQSILFGSVSDINMESGNIVFTSIHKQYSIPLSKIIAVQVFNPAYVKPIHVKMVFMDGSKVFGILIKEDGEDVVLSTVLGEVSYPREQINRIEYFE